MFGIMVEKIYRRDGWSMVLHWAFSIKAPYTKQLKTLILSPFWPEITWDRPGRRAAQRGTECFKYFSITPDQKLTTRNQNYLVLQ